MRYDWTKVGADYNGTPELRDRLLAITNAIDRASGPIGGQFDCWLALPGKDEPPLSLGMMQGMGIENAIKEFKIPKVSHVAVTSACAPMGFYGIRGHYKNVRVDIWFMDDGVSLTPVLAKVYEPEDELQPA